MSVNYQAIIKEFYPGISILRLGNREFEGAVPWGTKFVIATGELPDFDEVTARQSELDQVLADRRDDRVRATKEQGIKAEAQRRIYEKYPAHVQANLLAEGISLNHRAMAGEAGPDDPARADELEAVWQEIAAIRTKSNEIEEGLTALSGAALLSFDPADPEKWEPAA